MNWKLNHIIAVVTVLLGLQVYQFVVVLGYHLRSEPKRIIEHQRIFEPGEKTVPRLDKLASEGWELVTCRRANDGGGEFATWGDECFLRRVKP